MDPKTALRTPLMFIGQRVNLLFAGREPWQIATISASTALSLVWLWSVWEHNESE